MQTIIFGKEIKYEVFGFDLGNTQMNWYDAKLSCENIGDRWRLPNKDELNLLYKNKEILGILPLRGFWSISELDNEFAHYQYFFNGMQYVFVKTFYAYVRPIRNYLL
jgi:hypothetical protein